MKKSLVLIALLASGCSRDPEAARLPQRIAELEEENAKLQRELQKSRNDVAALQRIMNSNNIPAEEGPVEDGTPGQPAVPQPNNPGGGMGPAS